MTDLRMMMAEQAVAFMLTAKGEPWAPVACYLHNVACLTEHTAPGDARQRGLAMLAAVREATEYMEKILLRKIEAKPAVAEPQSSVRPAQPFTLRSSGSQAVQKSTH